MKEFAIHKTTRRAEKEKIPGFDKNGRIYHTPYKFPSYSILVRVESHKGKVVFTEDSYDRRSLGSNLARDSYAEVCRRVEEHEFVQSEETYLSLSVEVHSYMYQSENWYTVWTTEAGWDDMEEYYNAVRAREEAGNA